VILAGAVIPFLTRWPTTVIDQYRGWIAFLQSMSRDVVGSYRDLWTIVRLLDWPISVGAYRAIQLVTGLAVLVWTLRLRGRRLDVRGQLTLTLAMGSAWLLILGPAVEYNTYVVLAPTAAWAVMTAFEQRQGRSLAAAAFAMTMVLGAGAVERMLEALQPVPLLVLPVGTMLFVMWLAIWGRQCGAAAGVGRQ
jgi:hypothetical protein